MTPTRLLPLLLLLALLVGSASASPAGAYFVVHMSQHHWGSHYEPSGYTAPKEVSDNIVVFALVCLVLGPLFLVGAVISQGNVLIMTIIAMLALVVIIGYVFPTFILMSNAMLKETCVPNTAFNTSCGDE